MENKQKYSPDNSMEQKKKKMRVGENNMKKEEPRMCHQCKRNDKERVVCCSKCKAKRFCIRCITRWYPGMLEEVFLEACPVCRNICNCIECLRLNGLARHLKNEEVKHTDEEKLDFSKRIVRALLPALEQINTEQMMEKQIEYQFQAFPDSEVNIHKAEYEKDKSIYCNYCSAFIVDFHRSCSSCSYKLCLTCCKELSNGNLQADASDVHGAGCSMTSAKNGTAEVKTRDQIEWEPMGNGGIPCPPKDMGGCSEGTLSLKCLFSEYWISELLQKAKEVAQKCDLKDMHIDSQLHYSKGESHTTSGGTLREAATREDSDDNYVFFPAAANTRRANLRLFRLYLAKGEPVVVTNVHKNALGLSWDPTVMSRACPHTKKSRDVISFSNWCKLEMNIHQFFKGYTEGRFYSYGWPQLLKLTPSELFDEGLSRHGVEFSRCVPFMEYTHPQYGYLNLALRLPDNCAKPKAYIAYGFPMELGRGDSVTKLRYAMTDTVNVLMHTQAMVPTVQKMSAIEKLKQNHKAEEQREFVADTNSRMQESIKNYIAKGKSVLKGMKFSQEKQNGEDSTSVFGPLKPPGFEDADGGALWDVFRRQDVPKLEEYLRKHFREFRHTYGLPLQQVVHPIFDETFYLSTEHKRRLKEEYGIEPWTFIQKLGEAVFVPAGCPHQVRNLKSCINVAAGFISPENVNESIRLTQELRKLPRNHVAKEDKLGVKKIIVYAMSQAVNQLEKTQINSEAGIGTELAISSSISKSINAMPGPSMPKSSSVSEDPSNSMTANREEYVAPSEDEERRTAEVILHSPLPVLSANKAQESTSAPSQALMQLTNIEDVESTYHTVQSFLKSLPEHYPSQQSGLQSNTTSSSQTLAKTNFEEDRKKLDLWIRSEERLKAENDKNEEEIRELEALLEDRKKRWKEIMDERQEGSREAQKLVLLAQEKAGNIESSSNELVTSKMQ